MQLSVIGAGSWGTALARLLARKGHAVSLWVYEADLAEALRHRKENDRYLPGFSLPESVRVGTDMEEALAGTKGVVFAVPSHVARGVLSLAAPFLSQKIPVVSATKGIERTRLVLISEMMQEALKRQDNHRIAVLSGPSFAQEVAMEYPTAVTLAAADLRLALRLQAVFSTAFFKPFLSSDWVGVQLGGALKNVIALCAGISDGLGFASNTKAALMTRGLAEMARLGVAMGADVNTFYGLSGMGDLFLTCTGHLSRNRRVGEEIGRGGDIKDILAGMRTVAEGVATTESVMALSQRHGVEMPIVHAVHQVLFQGKPPRKAVDDLMAQARGKETAYGSHQKPASGNRRRAPVP